MFLHMLHERFAGVLPGFQGNIGFGLFTGMDHVPNCLLKDGQQNFAFLAGDWLLFYHLWR